MQVKNSIIQFISILFVSVSLSAQTPQEFGKSIVNTLASPQYYGRGYVNNGSKKAAQFIEKKFKKYGLKPFGSSYQQPFYLDVNTFPDTIQVTIDNKKLTPGKDFIVEPVSGSSKGTFVPLWIDSTNFPAIIEQLKSMRIAQNTIFIIDSKDIKDADERKTLNELKYYLSSMNPVISIENNKFTWSVASQNASNAILSVKREFLTKDTKQITLNIKNKLIRNYESSNVIGYIPGRKKNKYVVVTAHYDHLGMMGTDALFPGANDNASGTAMLLYLAKYYSTHKPKYNMVFMSFGAEEAGIIGSKFYTEHPVFPLEKIKFLVNLDLAGTGDEGIKVVNGTLYKKQFKKLAKINLKKNYLEKVYFRGPAANSDHYWFTQKGVPAFFIYTLGGIKAYHDIYDKPETLPLTEFNDYSHLLIDFFKKI